MYNIFTPNSYYILYFDYIHKFIAISTSVALRTIHKNSRHSEREKNSSFAEEQ